MQTRRQFVTGAAAATGAVVFVPTSLAATGRSAAAFRGGKFSEGLASGDPSTDAISLWTRLHDLEGAGTVELEVATDKAFKKVVARKNVKTSAASGHAVKARVTKLKPHEEYFYRFSTRTKDSPVGKFRTALPAGSKETVRFAFFSCQDYTHGFYNAHEIMADGDYDFVVCMGDYIYAETYHDKANTKTAVRDDKIGKTGPNKSIVREAVSLSDYRKKYELYRSDKALREVHQNFPMILTWDDHEVQDNYAGKEPDGGLPPEKRFSNKRRKAAEKAFYESFPAFAGANGQRIYRTIKYGTVDITVMDQRRYRADQPCNDAVAPPCEGYDAPRDLLGRNQMDFVKSSLKSSKAAWKILANEVTMMPTRVLNGSNFTYDTWIGYPRERQELLAHIRDNAIKDVVFVTGDIHTFIAGDVKPGNGDSEPTVATEFVGGSITSQSLGETDIDAGGGVIIKGNDANPKTDPGLIATLRGFNPHVDNADFDHHGFGEIVATQTDLTCQMVRLETIKKKSRTRLPDAEWKYVVTRGNPSVKGQHGPPAS